MKSVDRDFYPSESAKLYWIVAYFGVAVGAFGMFMRFWDEVHHQALSFHILVHIVPLPFLFIFPLLLSLFFRRYIRCALKENLISERVAKNIEHYLGMQLIFVYLTIMQFATWN